jgi:hypothetical protein
MLCESVDGSRTRAQPVLEKIAAPIVTLKFTQMQELVRLLSFQLYPAGFASDLLMNTDEYRFGDPSSANPRAQP